jgi:hypothetical protein
MLNTFIDGVLKKGGKTIFLVAPSGSGKTKFLLNLSQKEKLPYISLNVELSKKINELTIDDKDWEIFLSDIINGQKGDIILLDNTELLFTRDFNINPIRLLKNQSRKKVIIMSWNGEYNGINLIYGSPGDMDYRNFSKNDLNEIEIVKISDLR